MKVDDKRHRLPCRGCLINCRNYDRCNGAPWRMAPTVVKTDTKDNTNELSTPRNKK